MAFVIRAGLKTRRLILEPLHPEHAVEMVPVLAHPGLYEFTGGQPPTLEELTHRYLLQSAGAPRRSFLSDTDPYRNGETWLNWIVRTRNTGAAAGFVQATVRPVAETDSGITAELAWVVGRNHQGRGYATEAAQAMAGELIKGGVVRFSANIHPGNLASAAVAAGLGMRGAGTIDEDGEELWLS